MAQLCPCPSALLSNIFLVHHHLHQIALRPLVLYHQLQLNRISYTQNISMDNLENQQLSLLVPVILSEVTRAREAGQAHILTINPTLQSLLLSTRSKLALRPASQASIKANSRPCHPTATLSPTRLMKVSLCLQLQKLLGWPTARPIQNLTTTLGPMATSFRYQHRSHSVHLVVLRALGLWLNVLVSNLLPARLSLNKWERPSRLCPRLQSHLQTWSPSKFAMPTQTLS